MLDLTCVARYPEALEAFEICQNLSSKNDEYKKAYNEAKTLYAHTHTSHTQHALCVLYSRCALYVACTRA